MTHFEFLRKYPAIYRCCDDITNLKIRIKLRMTDLDGEDSNGWDETILKWQEKVFSKSEREFYQDEKNCITDLEKKYHMDVIKGGDPQKWVFSYTTDDDFTQDLNALNVVNVDEEESLEYDYKKSLMASVRNPTSYNEVDSMFIMADFGEYVGTSWIKNEEVLVSIKYDKNRKVMSVYPDFTYQQPYRVTLEGATFEYFVQDVSDAMSEDDQHKEKELIKKLNSHKLEKFDTTFKLPPQNELQVYLFFEILWAREFEYDTIYVQYFIDLPPDWSCDDSSQLQGITQTCRCKNEENLAHFGHVFDVVLNYNIESLGRKELPRCPYIYFEIISKDTWSRYRTEGLTYKNLPVAKPGNYRFELQCFRLIPDSVSGQLRRFFIGDCSNYNDITWIGLPKDYEGYFLNKYGTNTVGTGQIGIRMNVIQQSQAFREKSENGDIFEKLNSSSLVKSVEQVLQAFKRARKNMIAARKNL